MNPSLRPLALVGATVAAMSLVLLWMGAAYGTRMLVEGACMAIIALGLTIQWGYAGLFNAGIVGFIAAAAFVSMIVSVPGNERLSALAGQGALTVPLVILCVGVALTVAATTRRWSRPSSRYRSAPAVVLAVATFIAVRVSLNPTIDALEAEHEWIGGLDLPLWAAWPLAALAAAGLGWAIGRVTLGLRADYLAIATLGISEIVIAFLKNADWLTRGTVTVSPLPWPVPPPQDLGFVASRGLYLGIAAAVIAVIFLMLERAWASPWGRMMRAIRDNEASAAAMGKDVNRRRLEIFVLGNGIVGLGGAMLVTSTSIFDPTGFSPLNHTFLIWIMVILGGAGNNLGTVLGAFLVYAIWTVSEPASLFLFQGAADWAQASLGWEPPSDLHTRALQMRVFLIGLAVVVVLRVAPGGLLPEKPIRYE